MLEELFSQQQMSETTSELGSSLLEKGSEGRMSKSVGWFGWFVPLHLLITSCLLTENARSTRHPTRYHPREEQSQHRGLKHLSHNKGYCPAIAPVSPAVSFTVNNDIYRHFLVGVKNVPNSDVPPVLRNKTSGAWLNGLGGSPFNYIPGVGYSDMEVFVVDDDDVDRTFWLLSAGGYGFSFNSQDYALHLSVKRFDIEFTYRRGPGSTDPNAFFRPAIDIDTILLSDPAGLIQWENGAEIQVAYRIPDLSWLPFKKNRILTGRDFQSLGMALVDTDNDECAIVSDGWVPSIFGINPRHGVVTSQFVRIPEITRHNDAVWRFTDEHDKAPLFLSTASDKVHCSDVDLYSIDGCGIVDPDTVADTMDGMFRRVDPGTGFSGLTWLKSGYVVGFLQWTIEHYEYDRSNDDNHLDHFDKERSARADKTGTSRGRSRVLDSGGVMMEPGVRVYLIQPGDCSETCIPEVSKFVGFYSFEKNANRVGDVSALRDDDRKVIVIEQGSFPEGHLWPPKTNPASKLCLVDLTSKDSATWIFTKKKCIINFYAIEDPFKISPSGKNTYAFSRYNKDALSAYDDYCVFVGTATDFPFTNDWAVDPISYPLFTELQDPNFMIVCFLEPVLDRGFPHFE